MKLIRSYSDNCFKMQQISIFVCIVQVLICVSRKGSNGMYYDNDDSNATKLTKKKTEESSHSNVIIDTISPPIGSMRLINLDNVNKNRFSKHISMSFEIPS